MLSAVTRKLRPWLERWPLAPLFGAGRDRRTGLGLLGAALLAVVLVMAFAELADDVGEGETRGFDEQVLRSLRRPDDPAVPVGPAWLREVGIDLTALGSHVVLGLVVVGVTVWLLLHRQRRGAAMVLVATVGAMLLSTALKHIVARGRPTVVPHLREVTTPSFPSGHAMLSAAVYLTLGVMLVRLARGRLAKLYCLAAAMLLTLLVGLSRIYLGVHYPTDVLAGWAAGLVWALVCWAASLYLDLRRKEPPRDQPAHEATVDRQGYPSGSRS